MKRVLSFIVVLAMLLSLCVPIAANELPDASAAGERVITAAPEWVNNPFGMDKSGEFKDFYKKCVYVYGIPIVSTEAVPDEALYKYYDVIELLLRKINYEKKNVIDKMIENGVHMIIVGKNETNAMHPSWAPWQSDKTERRGGGGVSTTVLEEDLIVPSNDTWRQNFAGLIHEAAHTLLTYGLGDAQGVGVSDEYYKKINTCYENAVKKGMYPAPNEYDASNYHEYFTGQVGRFFNGSPTPLPVDNYENLTDREQLEVYDIDMYRVLEELFGKYDLPSPWGSGENSFGYGENYMLSNENLKVEIGECGQIASLKIANDIKEEFCDTEYVLNEKNAPNQAKGAEHQYMGELIFTTKKAGGELVETRTSEKERTIKEENGVVSVFYDGEFGISENYYLEGDSLVWEIEVTNTSAENMTFYDFGLPMPFNQYWTAAYNGEELYDTRCVYHSFVGLESSYIYAQRPSGQGKLLLFTPRVETGAKLEYRDHWRQNNGHAGSAWAQDSEGYNSGLDVFYIHSENIKKTGSGYLKSSKLELKGGESKKYAFEFTVCDDEKDMKSKLYQRGIVDAVAVPSMAFAKNMPAAFYLHANDNVEIGNIEIDCIHNLDIYKNRENFVNNDLECTKKKGEAIFREKVVYEGENYYVYDLSLYCLGVNHATVSYKVDGVEKETVLQFYLMDDLSEALDTRSAFLTKHQTDTPGQVGDKTFDDWMMDSFKNRAETMDGYWDMSYWGYGDDWSWTHGEFLAQKNIYRPVKEEIKAVDEYLDVAVWNNLMREHQEDYLIHNFLSSEPNLSPTYRGYAYPHIYNTYFAMYKIADRYPDMIEYAEKKTTYLLRAYNILCALYEGPVAYNWATGLMGEISTPEIIASLYAEGLENEAKHIEEIMAKKYENFKNTKYPYGSEYSYDNTGEEAVYTLAKMNENKVMMEKIDLKTRACRGVQPVWYFYSNPVTICGENFWNFQYTTSLAGYCMNDYLMLWDEARTDEERAEAARANYGGKMAAFTVINSGQIDSDERNVGTVAWTYQAELGHSGGQGLGGGRLHNGWSQMSGEADLGLYGGLEILSSDVAKDPIFGLTGYGCKVSENVLNYIITPLDGLFVRFNLINEKLGVELNGDTYKEAMVYKNKAIIYIDAENKTGEKHFSTVEVTGLEEGEKYSLLVDGEVVCTLVAEKKTVFEYYTDFETAALCIKKAKKSAEETKTEKVKSEIEMPERGMIGNGTVLYTFEADTKDLSEEKIDGKDVGGVKTEKGALVCDGTVKSYVRLSNALTNKVDDFTLTMKIAFDKMQNNGTRLVEFSDMKNRNLSVLFGKEGELSLNINGVDYQSGVYFPEKYDGEITLRQKDDVIGIFADEKLVCSIRSEFTLASLDEVQRNYIGRGSDDTKAAFCGMVYEFSFRRGSEDLKEGEKATAVSHEKISVTKTGERYNLPKSVVLIYSDGFRRKAEAVWNTEAVGDVIFGEADFLKIEAQVREVDFSKNKALDARADASYCAGWETVDALNDDIYTLETSAPAPENVPRFGTWTRDSVEEWMQYTWDEKVDINAIGIIFFDDNGGTRAPVSYDVEYLDDNGNWKKAEGISGAENKLLCENITTFETLHTKAVRVVMQKGNYAGVGVLEWRVY